MKLGRGNIGLAVVRNFPKVTKNYWILSAVLIHADFANFRWSSAKKCEYFSSKFQCKNDRLSFLFEMTCETWLWHDRFGSGTSFPKSYRRGLNFVNSNIYRFWPKNGHFVFAQVRVFFSLKIPNFWHDALYLSPEQRQIVP